jgi:hypothetical protein
MKETNPKVDVYFFSEMAHTVVHFHRLAIYPDGYGNKVQRCLSSSYGGICSPSFYASNAYGHVKHQDKLYDWEKIKELTPREIRNGLFFRHDPINPDISVFYEPVYICPDTGIVWKPIRNNTLSICMAEYQLKQDINNREKLPKDEKRCYVKKLPRSEKYHTVRDCDAILWEQKRRWKERKFV